MHRFLHVSVPRLLATVFCLLPAGSLDTLRAAPASGPSRVILTWSGDPARTQDVTWRMDKAGSAPRAQIARFSPDPGFARDARTVSGASRAGDLGEGPQAIHGSVQFTGLEPGTRYSYRVGDSETWSEWHSFRTAAASSQPFRFIYLGDAQNDIRSLWSRAVRAAYAAAPDARFLVHAGDLHTEGWDDRLWGEWFDAMGFISAGLPSVPVPGNHDLHRRPGAAGPGAALQVSALWALHFRLPDNGPDLDELRGQSYYLDYQDLRIIALDVNAFANERLPAEVKHRVRSGQLAWLDKILSNNPKRWTVVVQHQPIYAMAEGRDYKEMRSALEPVFERGRVDLVLEGHDHIYARTHKVSAGRIVEPSRPGVLYAMSVSGPKMYKAGAVNQALMAVTIQRKQMFQILDVAAGRLAYTACSIDGAVADRFEIRKSGAGTTYVDLSGAAAAAGAPPLPPAGAARAANR